MNLQPPRHTARTSLHGRWALTPPSHPYPCGRLFSSALLRLHRQLSVRKWSALRCPDFPLLPCGNSDKPADCIICFIYFRAANIVKTERRKNKLVWFFLPRCLLYSRFISNIPKPSAEKTNLFDFFAEVNPIFEVYLKDTDFYAIEEIFACNNKFGIKKEPLIMWIYFAGLTKVK